MKVQSLFQEKSSDLKAYYKNAPLRAGYQWRWLNPRRPQKTLTKDVDDVTEKSL